VTLAIFVGPTLSQSEVQAALPQARVLGPVACGDVYLSARDGCRVIGIIDGVFDQTLAVRHKEILWALSQGVRVFGAASMGALRAAELSSFGMEGVGTVFSWFASGELEDDDEVAVAHGDERRHHDSRSVALVNIRATLAAAVDASALDARNAESIIQAAKSLYYVERTWKAVFARARGTADDASLARCAAYVAENGTVDIKALDARTLIRRLATEPLGADTPEPKFQFADTEAWNALKRKLDSARVQAPRPEMQQVASTPETLAAMWAAVRRRGAGFADDVWRSCVERAASLMLARQLGAQTPAETVQAASDTFRLQRNLASEAEMERWMRENQLNLERYAVFIEEQVLSERMRPHVLAMALAQLPAVLCASGDLPRIWREITESA
jgi:hypothetical protein